ncbi:prolipoprotein diacylglyceryl transferase family protein [Pengzhenrongella phosphoraccumulans]|uniref:prolipoprotein diacylglyceryl transferase family protein n=1 Tax=Pengzhenrongella phosphoraccumulans TaxID=3114394 RepID=UPI003891017B
MAAISGGSGPGWPLNFVTLGVEALASMEPQAIGLTYWFDAAPQGDPYQVAVRFTGRRLDVEGKPGPADAFQVLATMDHVIPGSGRVALTHRVLDAAPGRWQVTADAREIELAVADGARPTTRRLPRSTTVGVSTYAPLVRVRAPGVVLGAWPALVGLGVVAALIVQSVLAARRGLPVTRVFFIAALACLLGLAGAKVYHRVTHLEEKGGLFLVGMSIQGFVIAALGTFVVGAAAGGMSIGLLLDVTVPALLLGQAIGRLGCFFAGCCAGLPTSSRWGLWSSDRTVGARRIPVQLMESGLAGVLAVATLITVLLFPPAVDGLVFVAGFALYLVGRQLLFPLRGVPRKTAHGRQITLVVASAAFLASVAAALNA